jgi:Raf kinase inhibitor-like YbhB/YbcL family protein
MLRKMCIFIGLVCIVAFGIFYFAKTKQSAFSETEKTKGGNNMEITSVFKNNERIPSKYTCDGDDLGPELNIAGTPNNAKSLVFVIDDPDAPMGTFTHYILFNIAPETKTIHPSNPQKEAIEGMNDFRKTSYGGPCPPNGTHRYFFKIFALDTILNLEKGTSRLKLQDAMRGHILDKNELIGLYARH